MPLTSRLRVLAVLLVVTLGLPSPAGACINGTMQRTDGWTWEVQRAEKSLAFADHAGAAARVIALFPAALDLAHADPRAELLARARRVLALAIARTGGALDLGDGMSGKTATDRRAALAWSATFLRARLAEAPDDPVRQVDLAEALAHDPAERSAALALLRDLALADLLPEPRSWALLGAVAAALDQPEVGRLAGAHCRQIASQGHLCTLPPLS